MIYRVKITPYAAAEVRAAFTYIKVDSPAAARRWYKGIMASVKSLDRLAMRCPVAPDSKFCGKALRVQLYASHRILFHINDDQVEILSVRHAAQRFFGE